MIGLVKHFRDGNNSENLWQYDIPTEMTSSLAGSWPVFSPFEEGYKKIGIYTRGTRGKNELNSKHLPICLNEMIYIFL
jgi:hypothetical protein